MLVKRIEEYVEGVTFALLLFRHTPTGSLTIECYALQTFKPQAL
jgi:hypothetical protein